MSETTSPPGEPLVEPTGRRWPSPVWLVPLAALVFAFVLLYQEVAGQGPLIEIEFKTAAGLKAGETVVRYRDVDVGRVEDIRFTEDLARVVVEVRMEPSVAPYVDESAEFWVVRPQVSAQGVTGLETVLTGSYVGASWDREPGELQRSFTARDEPPLTPSDAAGIRIRLRATDGGSLEVGSPLFFKRVEVGRVEAKRLSDDGTAVEFDAFVSAPNDSRVTTSTRFWNASGVDLNLGADGARLRIASLSSLIRGGASFDTPEGGDPVEDGHVFELFPSEGEAMDIVAFSDPEDQVELEILFRGSVRGLSPGAAVEYRGIRVGRVQRVSASVDPETSRFRTRTRIAVSPALLGLADGGREALMRFLRAAVTEGLRAKLALGSLLTGALYVELEDVPDAPFAAIDETREPPILPAIASDLDELAGSVEGVLDRVNALPIEALMGNAVALLDNLNKIAASEDLQNAPGEALAVLRAAEALLSGPATEGAEDAQATLAAFRAIAEDPAVAAAPGRLDALLESLGALAAALEEGETAENLAASLAAFRALAEDPAVAAAPARLDAALAAATALLTDPETAAVPARLNETLAAARSALAAPGIEALPGEFGATLASLRARLDDPALAEATAALPGVLSAAREGLDGAAAELTPTLAALRALLEAPATQETPEVLNATLVAARGLLEDDGLRAASGEAAGALAALRALLEEPGTRAAPGELSATLKAARGLLADLEQARAAENLSRTLAAARRLAEDPALTRAADAAAGAMIAIQTVLSAPEADRLPAATTAALNEAAGLMRQFQAENLGGEAAGALAGVTQASEAVRVAMAALPPLLARLTDVSARADALLASVSVGSELNYEAVTAIRDIRDAARAVTDLADAVRQKPNSIILGR
ncbi:MAG: MlaD family protein [Pseudomonadota bacterium]